MTGRVAEGPVLRRRYPAIVACIDDSVICTGTVRESAAIELAELVAEVEALRELAADRLVGE